MSEIAAGAPVEAPKQHTSTSNPNNIRNIIFAVVLILYEIMALPIFGKLYGLSGSLELFYNYGGILLVSITTILLIIGTSRFNKGMGLINTFVVRSSFSGMTFTLVIFALTVQHFMLFRAFWSKAGANDIVNSEKSFNSPYNLITLSNFAVDRQVTTLLPSGPFVEGIACALSLAVAFNTVVGRIGLLELFFLTLFGAFFYEVNAQLHWRWFITDNGFNYRIILFGATLGIVSSILLGKKETTIQHGSYRSEYRIMAFAMLGFLFMFVSLPILSTVSIFTQTPSDNSVLYATSINAWLATFAGVLGTFTSNSLFYRKFSAHDLIFTGLSGAFAFSSSADNTFNPCAPLISGFFVGFFSSMYAATFGRKINSNGVLFTFSHINRFFIPGFFGAVVSGIIQATSDSVNGSHPLNRLSGRTAIQQGGWQILGILITIGIALLAGLIIGVLYKIINRFGPEDQFNDGITYDDVPNPEIQTD